MPGQIAVHLDPSLGQQLAWASAHPAGQQQLTIAHRRQQRRGALLFIGFGIAAHRAIAVSGQVAAGFQPPLAIGPAHPDKKGAGMAKMAIHHPPVAAGNGHPQQRLGRAWNWGCGQVFLLADRLPGINIQVAEVIKHANPTRDFSNVALRIKGLKPDLVIMSNYQNEYVLLARTLHQQRIDVAAMFSVLGGGFNYRLVKEQPQVAQHMMDFNHWFDPKNPKALEMKRKVEATGNLFTFEVYCGWNSVMLYADALERAATADKEKVIAALESSTWSDHFMPYGPTKFVNGQNTGGTHAACADRFTAHRGSTPFS